MTTEVIIKNKSGLVLAADSAVTVTGIGLYGQSSKVYNSANKLFTLSKTEPVGVLVYNAASINEVPVEIVLKEFRDKKRKYNKLKQYQEELLNFIESFINKNTKRKGLINFFDGFLYSFEGFIEQEKNEKQQDFDVDALIKRHEKGLALFFSKGSKGFVCLKVRCKMIRLLTNELRISWLESITSQSNNRSFNLRVEALFLF